MLEEFGLAFETCATKFTFKRYVFGLGVFLLFRSTIRAASATITIAI